MCSACVLCAAWGGATWLPGYQVWSPAILLLNTRGISTTWTCTGCPSEATGYAYCQLVQILTCVISNISPISKTMLPPFIKAEGAKTAESHRPSSGCGRPVSDWEKGHSGINRGLSATAWPETRPVGNHLRGTPGCNPLLLPPNTRQVRDGISWKLPSCPELHSFTRFAVNIWVKC